MRSVLSHRDTRLNGRIRTLAAPKVTIGVGDQTSQHKLLLLVFAKDGGFYVQFPYGANGAGIVACLEFGDTGSIAGKWHLERIGHLTLSRAKFTHHVDGEAHFSQDGKLRTTVRRQSFRLDTSIGHAFQVTVFNPRRFEEFSESDARRLRPSVMSQFSPLPDCVSIVAQWRRIAPFEQLYPPSVKEVGPIVSLRRRVDGGQEDLTLLANPHQPSVAQYVLTITAVRSQLPEGASGDASVVFIGGWDPHEVAEAGQKVRHTGALIASYPVQDPERLRGIMSVLDLSPDSKGAL